MRTLTFRAVVTIAFLLATAFLFYRWRQSNAAKEGPSPPGNPSQDPDQSHPTRRGPHLDRAMADRMREQIRSLIADAGLAALGGTPLPEAPSAPSPAFSTMPRNPRAGESDVDPDYIEQRIREDLIPLAKDCYQTSLEKNPNLAGRLQVSFKIIGDPKVGGVVDEVNLVDGTTLEDPYVQTCVKESMMAVSFAAPPGGESLDVIFPLAFSPDQPEGGNAP